MVRDFVPVLDHRGFYEERTGKRAPLLEALGLAKRDHVCIDALPADDQTILGRVLDNALESHGMASSRRLEMGSSLANSSFECVGTGGINRDVSDFGNHPSAMA